MKKLLLAAVASLGFAGSAQAALVDGGFETQGASVSNYCYFLFPAGGNAVCPTGAWQGSAGMQDEGNGPWPGVATPDGSKYGFVQINSNLGQLFTADRTGTYKLSWLDAGRPSNGGSQGNQDYNVTVGASNLGNYSTVSGQAWGARTSGRFTLTGGQSYALIFQGLTTSGDNTSYIDAVSLNAVPEPASWALMVGGFGLAGAAMRRRRAAPRITYA